MYECLPLPARAGGAFPPDVLCHSAAVPMAEDGVGVEQVQQFLGHQDIETTRSIYARFSPM
jgi:site-specific recombinase XerD